MLKKMIPNRMDKIYIDLGFLIFPVQTILKELLLPSFVARRKLYYWEDETMDCEIDAMDYWIEGVIVLFNSRTLHKSRWHLNR